jgi:hypothetical protein
MTILCNSKTVTDRLILHVDFANPKCYPGTGTAFYDMVDKTRLPGDSYGDVSVANGTMNFVRPYGRIEHQVASIPDLHTFTGASAFTFSIAYRLNAYPPIESSANRSGVMMKGAYGPSYGIALQHSGDSNGVRTYTQLMYGLRNADSSIILDLTPGVRIFPGQWCKADMTYRFFGSNVYIDFYVNGVLAHSYYVGGYATPPNIGNTANLNFAGGILSGNNVYCDQSIASYSVYSKALSAKEIQQNFLSTKARLGI